MSDKNVVVTPHIGEMSRLTGLDIAVIKNNPIDTARTYSREHNCVCVLKDARTIVSDGERVYIICQAMMEWQQEVREMCFQA